MDAAYHGNWDALFKIAVRSKSDFAIGRFANSTRLRPKSNDGNWKPSGYTALHQAAWYGAPVEIVQGIAELGASRGSIISILLLIIAPIVFVYRWH